MVDPNWQEFDPQEFERQNAPQKVALFERQFGKNYRLLAYHAALPLVLTPELVHYLRTEFLLDLVPSWEAEADLLLSDLCSPVGYELYVMDTAVRAYLLDQMQKDDDIPPDRMQAVAQVLMSYVLYLSRLNPGQRERELQAQRWAAMAYLGDDQCRKMADEIAQQFEASGGQGNSTAVKAEFARLAQITQELEPQLREHPELVEFARRVGQVFRSPETLPPSELRRTFVVGDRHLQLPESWWDEFATSQFPSLEILEFTTGHLEDDGDRASQDGRGFPPLQTAEFEIATVSIEFEEEEVRLTLEPFEFTVATIQRKTRRQSRSSGKKQSSARKQSIDWTIQRKQQQAYRFFEPLGPSEEDGLLEMVMIPEGTFLMGSPKDEPDRLSSEGPQHEVTVQPFFMGRYPVTQVQWRFVAELPQVERELGPDPSRFKGENLPVEQVSWYDAVEFCARLSRHSGREYRLPTEAKWEYACRAGTTTPFHFGQTLTFDLANYDSSYVYNDGPKKKYREKTTPVGQFDIANAFGLCDMHGNVLEWCQDYWHENYKGAPTDGSAWIEGGDESRRILRGGSWYGYPRNCRSAYRFYLTPDLANGHFGFRVVCVAPIAL